MPPTMAKKMSDQFLVMILIIASVFSVQVIDESDSKKLLDRFSERFLEHVGRVEVTWREFLRGIPSSENYPLWCVLIQELAPRTQAWKYENNAWGGGVLNEPRG